MSTVLIEFNDLSEEKKEEILEAMMENGVAERKLETTHEIIISLDIDEDEVCVS